MYYFLKMYTNCILSVVSTFWWLVLDVYCLVFSDVFLKGVTGNVW